MLSRDGRRAISVVFHAYSLPYLLVRPLSSFFFVARADHLVDQVLTHDARLLYHLHRL